jgi:hypothetical protein
MSARTQASRVLESVDAVSLPAEDAERQALPLAPGVVPPARPPRRVVPTMRAPRMAVENPWRVDWETVRRCQEAAYKSQRKDDE